MWKKGISGLRQASASAGGRWALRLLALLLFAAIFGDFIANEKPLYCKQNGKHFFPVFRSYAVSIGIAGWPQDLDINWREAEYEAVIRAPVPYSASTLDGLNANYRGPFDRQDVRSMRWRHWLGTDQLGRDVLAGLIRGARISLAIGIFSMLLAALIGIPLGATVGYFGNDRLQLRLVDLLLCILLSGFGLYYLLTSIAILDASSGSIRGLSMLVFALLLFAATAWIVGPANRRLASSWRGPAVTVPWDTIIMRSIEVIRSIPAFFILLAVLGIIERPSWVWVILLIGLLQVPSIVRYMRAEAMKIRDLSYIDSARVIGLPDRLIIWRHVIPNGIGPVLITLAFGIGSAVLVESGLSFLGIGMSLDEVSWGKLLSEARGNFSAWWLAVFPGLGIFLTIAVFNVLGDRMKAVMRGEGRSHRRPDI